MGLLEKLKTHVLTADGAIGTVLYGYGLEYCHEEMNVQRPELIEKKFIVNILLRALILSKPIHMVPTRLN